MIILYLINYCIFRVITFRQNTYYNAVVVRIFEFESSNNDLFKMNDFIAVFSLSSIHIHSIFQNNVIWYPIL